MCLHEAERMLQSIFLREQGSKPQSGTLGLQPMFESLDVELQWHLPRHAAEDAGPRWQCGDRFLRQLVDIGYGTRD